MIAPPDVLGLLLDALADRIATRIGAGGERETYDSRHLPPRCSRRRFAEVCRSGRVVDACREGRDWTCWRAAWETARTRKVSPPPTTPTTVPETSLDAKADALLSRAGLRVVRGSR